MENKNIEKYRIDIASRATGITLEVGFGSGLNLPYCTDVDKLYALDPSKELYNLAEERIKSISFPIEYLQASAEHIPLRDNTIDTVISTWSLCSISHPQNALEEILRVLKPNGKFLFIEHGKSTRGVITEIQNFLTPFSRTFAGGCHMNRNIEKLILDAGFQMQSIEKFGLNSRPSGFMYKGIASKSTPT